QQNRGVAGGQGHSRGTADHRQVPRVHVDCPVQREKTAALNQQATKPGIHAMNLTELLRPDMTFCNVQGVSKKRLLEKSAELIASRIDLVDAGELFEALIAREQLGSTGIGHGIAVPHCRVKNLTATAGALVKLQQPVDFD